MTTDDPVMMEWISLLEVASAYMVAAEEMIDGLQGKLGVDTREPNAHDKAVRETKRRVDAYQTARKAFVTYAQERQAMLR